MNASTCYGNAQGGIAANVASNNTYSGNSIYGNGTSGIALLSTSNNVLCCELHLCQYRLWTPAPDVYRGILYAGGGIGYSTRSVASADSSSDVILDNTTGNNLVLKNTLVNAIPGISSGSFSHANSYLVNNSTTPGVTQVFGDYTVSGSTLTFDYSTNTYASTSVNAKLMIGTGHSLSSIVTFDANTLTELITVTAIDSGHWSVAGSSSGVINASFACTQGSSCGFTSSKVNFTLNTHNPVSAGDLLDFVTIAASSDSFTQKNLLMGPSSVTGSAWNNNTGRSRIQIAIGAGFHAVGISTAPTLIDMLASGSTYFTFVDSGAFTISYSSISHTDENGIQLLGSGGIVMSSSTFDRAGSGTSHAWSTYMTVNSLTSTAVFPGMTFNNSLSLLNLYNITVSGSDAGLSWVFYIANGPWIGDGHEQNDVNNKIRWTYPGPMNPNSFFNVFD